MAVDGSLIFDTGLDSSGFKKGIAGLKTAAIAAAAAVTAVFTTGAAAVGTAYTSSMSQVAATMGITAAAEDYNLLSTAAKEMGASTKYSASQAADALNYLALAGYDAKQSVSALPTVLNLAAAGGIDLAYASDMVTDSMSALGLGMDQLEGFADQLAKTSQKSNTSVAQLGEAILTVGGTAKSLAGGVNELNTMLGIIADNGVKGAEGGTALRNVILSLSAPTDTAAKAMKNLGVSAYDLNGNLRYLPDVFADFNTALSSLSESQKAQILSDIFNKVDLKTVNALLGTSAERFDELAGYIADCDGAAAQMAETMSDNLEGDMLALQSALEGVGIAAFEKFENPMRKAVQSVTDILAKVNQTISGELSDKLNKIAESFSDIAIAAAKIIAEKGLPMLVDALSWVAEHVDEITSAAKSAAIMVAAFKGLTAASAAASAIQTFVTATQAAKGAQLAMNAAALANPYVLIGTAAIAGAAALAEWINKQRKAIGYEGEVKEAYNEANKEIAQRIGYLEELNRTDPLEAYKASVEGLRDTNNQLDENRQKLADLYNTRKQLNIQRDNINGYEDPLRMEELNTQIDMIDQEIKGIEEQNIMLDALRMEQEHIAGQYNASVMNARESAERYKQNIIEQNESGSAVSDIIAGIKARRSDIFSAYDELSGTQEEITEKLAGEWKRLNHEYSTGVITSEKDLYAQKKAVLEQYGNAELEDHWKYYEELYGYEQDFAKESAKLEEERLDKQLAALKSGYKKQLETFKGNISDTLSEYKKAMSELEGNISGYKNKLLSVGDIFSVSETEVDGKKVKTYTVENIKKQMEEMKKYHSYVKSLKASGAADGLIGELTSLDFEDGAQFGKYLSGLSESEFAKINEYYKERDALADELSKDLYAGEAEKINNALMSCMDSALSGLPEQAQEAGRQLLKGILSGMDMGEDDLSAKISDFSDGFSELYNSVLEDMDLENGFAVAFGGINTYAMGQELARDFASGFNEELAKSRAEITVSQRSAAVDLASGSSAANAANAGTNSGRSPEKSTEEVTVNNTVVLDGEVISRRMERKRIEKKRRTGS